MEVESTIVFDDIKPRFSVFRWRRWNDNRRFECVNLWVHAYLPSIAVRHDPAIHGTGKPEKNPGSTSGEVLTGAGWNTGCRKTSLSNIAGDYGWQAVLVIPSVSIRTTSASIRLRWLLIVATIFSVIRLPLNKKTPAAHGGNCCRGKSYFPVLDVFDSRGITAISGDRIIPDMRVRYN